MKWDLYPNPSDSKSSALNYHTSIFQTCLIPKNHQKFYSQKQIRMNHLSSKQFKTIIVISSISYYLRWMKKIKFLSRYKLFYCFKMSMISSQILASPRMFGTSIIWIQKVWHFSLSVRECNIKTLLLNYLSNHCAVSWGIPTRIIFPWGKARLKCSWKLCTP